MGDEHNEQVEFVYRMVHGWLKNLIVDAINQNLILEPEAISEAMFYLYKDFDATDDVIPDLDEEIRKFLEKNE